MTPAQSAPGVADAVRRFATQLRRVRRPTDRIQARLEGPGGMTRLCAVEAVLDKHCPPGTRRELVWLTRASAGSADTLHLSAFAAGGVLLCQAAFQLGEPGPSG